MTINTGKATVVDSTVARDLVVRPENSVTADRTLKTDAAVYERGTLLMEEAGDTGKLVRWDGGFGTVTAALTQAVDATAEDVGCGVLSAAVLYADQVVKPAGLTELQDFADRAGSSRITFVIRR